MDGGNSKNILPKLFSASRPAHRRPNSVLSFNGLPKKGIFSIIRGSSKAERKPVLEPQRYIFDYFCSISLDKLFWLL